MCRRQISQLLSRQLNVMFIYTGKQSELDIHSSTVHMLFKVYKNTHEMFSPLVFYTKRTRMVPCFMPLNSLKYKHNLNILVKSTLNYKLFQSLNQGTGWFILRKTRLKNLTKVYPQGLENTLSGEITDKFLYLLISVSIKQLLLIYLWNIFEYIHQTQLKTTLILYNQLLFI